MASKKTVTLDNLVALGPERLAAILVELADGDAKIKRRLRLELAAQSGDDTIAAEISKRLTALRSARSFVDWQQRRDFVKGLDLQRAMIVDRSRCVRAAGTQRDPRRSVKPLSASAGTGSSGPNSLCGRPQGRDIASTKYNGSAPKMGRHGGFQSCKDDAVDGSSAQIAVIGRRRGERVKRPCPGSRSNSKGSPRYPFRRPLFWPSCGGAVLACHQQSATVDGRLEPASCPVRWDAGLGATLAQILAATALFAAVATIGADNAQVSLDNVGKIRETPTPSSGSGVGRLD